MGISDAGGLLSRWVGSFFGRRSTGATKRVGRLRGAESELRGGDRTTRRLSWAARRRAWSLPIDSRRSRSAALGCCIERDLDHDVSILITAWAAAGRVARRAATPEPLDDDHATAAAWTRVRQRLGFVDLGITVIAWPRAVPQGRPAGGAHGRCCRRACRWRAGRSGGCGGSLAAGRGSGICG